MMTRGENFDQTQLHSWVCRRPPMALLIWCGDQTGGVARSVFSFSSLNNSKNCLIRCQRGSLPQNSRTARMLSSLLTRCDAIVFINTTINWLMTTPFVIILWSQNHLLVIDHRMLEMRLSVLHTPWNLPRCSILKASLYLKFSCCWPVWTWKISFRLLDVHQHTHGQISLVWTSDQVKPTLPYLLFCPSLNIYVI